MGDVRLPLRLSTSYYIAVSTSSVGEDTSSTSNAPLFTSPKPTFKFFRLPGHRTKHGKAKKVVLSPNWPFFRVIKSRGSETPSQGSLSSTIVDDGGDGVELFASQKSPSEKSSPVSSISPSSVLSKKMFIEKKADMMEENNGNGGRNIRRDSLESFISCNGAPTLSSVVEGEKEMKWDTFESFAGYDYKLPRSTPWSTPCRALEEGGANAAQDTIDDDEFFELDITKSECSSVYSDPSTSMRRSIGRDILKAEASNAMENSSEINEEEIQGDKGNPGSKASEVAPSLPDGKKAMTCRGDNPYFVLRLFERFSVIFMGKMLGAIGFSQGSHSTMLWMGLKKRIVLSAASQMRWAAKLNLSVKQAVKHRRDGGEVELWKKNIPMGRRCRVLELEDSSASSESWGRQLIEAVAKDAADVHMNSDGEEAVAEGFSLDELMEAAAEAPVFNWASK